MSFLLRFLSFSPYGKRGRKRITYSLNKFVIFFHVKNTMFDRNNNLLLKKKSV